MSEHILVQNKNAVCTIIFDRTHRKNALTIAMYDALSDALQTADQNQTIRAILITGAEGAFTAGNDLHEFMHTPPQSTDTPVFRFLKTLVHCTKPIVAQVDGVAIGIGTTMLLHCDFVYASDRSHFKMPFINLGLVPEAASSYLLPMSLGHRKAAELLLLGDRFDAHQATDFGIVNQATSSEALPHVVQKTLDRLVALPPKAMQYSKALLKAQQKQKILQVMEEEGEIFMSQLGSPENTEAINAFFDKRSPDFSKC